MGQIAPPELKTAGNRKGPTLPPLQTLAELLHWCGPPMSVLRALYPLAEAGQLDGDALAYLHKWEAIRGPAPVPELDGTPVAASSPAHRGAKAGR